MTIFLQYIYKISKREWHLSKKIIQNQSSIYKYHAIKSEEEEKKTAKVNRTCTNKTFSNPEMKKNEMKEKLIFD